MKRYAVHITPAAAELIEEAFEHIRAESEPGALRWLDEFMRAIYGLDVLPRGYPIAPEAQSLLIEYRMRVVGRYLVIFLRR